MTAKCVSRDLSPTQEASVRNSNGRVNLWHGAVRSGKTIGSLLRWLMFNAATIGRSGDLVMFGRTRDAVWRNCIGPLMDPENFGSVSAEVRGNYGAPTVHIFGRRVHVIGAHDVQSEMVIRGLTMLGGYGDEMTTIPEPFVMQVLARMSNPGGITSRLFGTTNPDSPQHWLKKLIDEKADDPAWRTFHFLLDDNPRMNSGAGLEYKEQIKREYTGLWYRRFILGQWVQADGAIYETWDQDRHVVDTLPDNLTPLGVGVDYGTTNPTRGEYVAYGGDPVRLYVTAEWAPGKGTEAQRSAELRQWLDSMPRTQFVHVDPAAAGFKQQLFNDGLTNVVSASNAVLPGIRLVSSLLAADRLRVHASCTELIKEIPGYMWDPKATEKGEDAPIKVNDHAVDALRYATYSTRTAWRRHIPIITASDEAPGTDTEGVAA